ncbi:uncharacterized protein LOC127779225 [Oryza glaberrima]|uniref:uncharacterized protein LOC127779225 n=1 Tax=Oryza glaberrima TaxID=4538 RepID=UPI00224C3242|nr:uncharacterized protein LOC127779225 [Oryza glaberrima]
MAPTQSTVAEQGGDAGYGDGGQRLDVRVQPYATVDADGRKIISKGGTGHWFLSEEEYVGVNDEQLYLPPKPTQPPDTSGQSSQPAATGFGGQSSQTAATGIEAPEVEVTDEDPQVVRVLHDPENPNIVKNALFPDMISFRKANNPKKGAKDARGKLQEQYEIKLKYSKAWSDMKLALEQIHGKYEESFQLLFNWKAEIERKCPGCRPYVGVDSTKLTGKYTGQLASTTSVDGHNWLIYVSYAIFDLETDDNWLWFMKQLNRVIGCPEGLVISTDACKGLEKAVSAAFSDPVEHRECVRHLYANFLKKYHGSVITENLYPVARSYTEEGFKYHMQQIYAVKPDAIELLELHHSRIWYICGFGDSSKCDYLTNNVSESFNAHIRNLKGLLPHELVDSIRELIMEKMATRRDVGKKMDDGIIPGVMKQLNDATSLLKVVKIARSDDGFAEVTLVDTDNKTRRHIVDLDNQKCSCRAWQITGKPCRHALAWICSSGGRIQDFVSPYYSVQMFRIAYAGRVPPMTDRTQWPVVDLGFKVHVPKQKRGAGRPRVQRIRGFLEPGRKRVKCKRCKRFGHFEKTCKLAEPTDADDMSSHYTPPQKGH